MTLTHAQWLATRVNGREIAHDEYVTYKLGQTRKVGRMYSGANDWVVFRDPSLSKGAWNWIAERTTRGSVELRGFDQLKHAKAWCGSAP